MITPAEAFWSEFNHGFFSIYTMIYYIGAIVVIFLTFKIGRFLVEPYNQKNKFYKQFEFLLYSVLFFTIYTGYIAIVSIIFHDKLKNYFEVLASVSASSVLIIGLLKIIHTSYVDENKKMDNSSTK
jgi:Ni/Fe-hydrogenase subunit HybB-like protein